MSAGESRRGLRILRRVLLGALVILITLAVIWMTGWPQRSAIVYAGREYLGAELAVRGVSTFGSLRIDELQIYDSKTERDANNPATVLSGVSVDYALRSAQGRLLPRITIASIEITLDATDPEDTNFDFLRDLLEEEKPPSTSNRFIPQQVEIGSITATVRTERATAELNGFSFTGAFADAENFDAQLAADALRGKWQLNEGTVNDVDEGTLYARIWRVSPAIMAGLEGKPPSEFGVRIDARVPNYLDTGDHLLVMMNESATDISIKWNSLRVFGTELSKAFGELLPIRAEFEVADFGESQITMRIVDGAPAFPDAKFSAVVTNLRVGEAEHEWYTGGLTFEAVTSAGETNSGEFLLALNEGQRLTANVSGNVDAGQIKVQLDDWTPEQVRGAAPVDFRSTIDSVSFDTLSGLAEATWSGETYLATAEVQSQGGGGEDPIRFAQDARGDRDTGPLLEGTLEARLGPGQVSAVANVVSEEAFDVVLTLTDVDPARWAGFATAAILPEDFEGRLSGTAKISAQESDEFAKIAPDLQLRDVTFGELSFANIALTGAASASKDFNALHGGEATLVADELHTLTLTNIVTDVEAQTASAQLAGKIDVSPFVADTEFGDLYGEFAIEGTLRYADGRVTGPMNATTGNFGYGDLGVPYGSTLAARGNLKFDTESRKGTLDVVEVELPDRAKVTSPSIAIAASPFTASGDVAIDAACALAVDMSLLGRAEGRVIGNAAFAINPDDGLKATWNAILDAKFLVLNEDAAFVDGAHAEAKGGYDRNGLSGDGTLTASKLGAAGASVRDISGGLVLNGETMRLGGLQGTLFGGRVIADVVVGVLEENMPINLSAQYEQLDLALLTEEVQPPQVKLTGIASGSATVEYGLEGLGDFWVHAESTENFSLDRETVEKMIFQQKILESFGTRQVQRILRELVGADPQRPFDSGEMVLRLEDERIKGTADLRSVKTEDLRGLSLLIELAIDPPVLADALVLLQQGDVSGVEF